MPRDFSTRFTGWSFIAAGAMLWVGWMLLPWHLGTFFQPDDFARIDNQFHWWIWTYRVHLFGMVVTAIALVALASQMIDSPSRVMNWPGVAVASAGMIVGALGAAFYYHHGAWGARETRGASAEELARFVEALRVDTEYVTCLVRFGRVFSGLGLLLVGCGLIQSGRLPGWTGWGAITIGVASMALTMLWPDQMNLYIPVFHVLCLWLAATGGVILLRGIRSDDGRPVAGQAVPGQPATSACNSDIHSPSIA
jgi:hypothetical protein